MVMLAVLHKLSLEQGWQLVVAHFNHQLRGGESDADQAFVEEAAKTFGLACVSEGACVQSHAAKERISLEMAARGLRHAFLAGVAMAHACDAVALAHHADDQVETFFVRLLRGAGGEGLSGMRWDAPSPANSAVRVIRPLLGEPRASLEAYARTAGIGHRDDPTNQHTDFLRNRIRHQLLPLLRREFQPGLDAAVLRAGELVGAESDYAGCAARRWLDGGEAEAFGGLHVAVQRRVLQLQLISMGYSVGFELVEKLRNTVEERIMTEPGHHVWRDAAGRVHSQMITEMDYDPARIVIDLSVGQGTIAFGGAQVEWRIEEMPSGLETRLERVPGEECFDAHAVGRQICMRHWRPGDRFQPIGMGNAVKLQDVFTDMKVPPGERRWRIIAESEVGNVFWVEGLRIGEQVRLRPATRQILRWRWSRLAN